MEGKIRKKSIHGMEKNKNGYDMTSYFSSNEIMSLPEESMQSWVFKLICGDESPRQVNIEIKFFSRGFTFATLLIPLTQFLLSAEVDYEFATNEQNNPPFPVRRGFQILCHE